MIFSLPVTAPPGGGLCGTQLQEAVGVAPWWTADQDGLTTEARVLGVGLGVLRGEIDGKFTEFRPHLEKWTGSRSSDQKSKQNHETE